ncbi:MAG: PEP-CTERM sorting domain-containing protein [Planctomycetia bacterium]|nr:PEP-CTERM sorting domain-containing protein [Planctomycetia bacterium]MCC7314636.1 PEP-CTERM sorting domain-containing protein [Planctomycetota bacterium]
MTTTDSKTTDGTTRCRLLAPLALLVGASLCLTVILWATPVRGDIEQKSEFDSRAVVVPEPATLAYVAVTAVALFRRRRPKTIHQGRR